MSASGVTCLGASPGGGHNPKDTIQDRVSSYTYSDNLNLLTESAWDLETQAGKVAAFSDWGSLKANTGKSRARNIPPVKQHSHPTGAVCCACVPPLLTKRKDYVCNAAQSVLNRLTA